MQGEVLFKSFSEYFDIDKELAFRAILLYLYSWSLLLSLIQA